MSSVRPDIDVHPKSFSAKELDTRVYDVVIIGAGPAGMTTAANVARDGLKVLIIEAELVGGECPYWACVPSKALLRPGEVMENVKAVGGARQRLELLVQKYSVPKRPMMDLEGLWNRRDMFAHGWNDEFHIKGITGSGIHVAHGFGKLIGVKRVEIKDWHTGGTIEVEAKQAVVLATGSTPVVPDIEGLKDSSYWTPREAVSSREVPEHLIVLGGGAVGSEMATYYAEIGSKVTLISSSLLPKMVPEAGKLVQEGLTQAGVDVRLGVRLVKVERIGKTVTSYLSDGSTVKGTEILIAAGRKARVTNLNLAAVEGMVNHDRVQVDDSMRVASIPEKWLYAVGDINGRAQLTHVGIYQAKLAARSIVANSRGTYEADVKAREWDKLTAKPTGRAIAQCVFSDPQVAACGLTPAAASARGVKTRTVSVQMKGAGSSLHAEGYQGWAQWVIDEEDRLVGATFVGRDVADLVQASTMAIVGGMTLDQIWHITPPFPTMSEVYTALSEAAEASTPRTNGEF